jgi:hypothetical protein
MNGALRSFAIGGVVLHLAAPGADNAPSPATPALAAAFSTHSIVAIAESRHAIRQAGDFYVSLIRDPGFQRAVNDVVIEFASGQSQPLLDRYVLDGDPVAPEKLASIRRDTTKVASWESPGYARWLAAMREVNRGLPAERRIRVLAGDTPVDWTRVKSAEDWVALGDNNVSFARVIEENVLAKRRKALVILGSNHLTRGGDRNGGPNTTTRVETRYPGSMYLVYLYSGRPGGESADARFASERWAAPALAPLRCTWVGALGGEPRPLESMADALLFVGPSQALEVEEAPASSFDPAYLSELDRRSAIEWGDSTRARSFLGLLPKP